jgi:nitroreductase
MTPTIDLLRSHRSIRHFTDEPITEAQREAIINSARATSSSSFLQCSSIIRITDPAMREQLVTLTGGQKHVAQAAEFWVSAPTLTATCRSALRPNWAWPNSCCWAWWIPR